MGPCWVLTSLSQRFDNSQYDATPMIANGRANPRECNKLTMQGIADTVGTIQRHIK